MASEPDDRYPTARDLGHALSRWSMSSGPPLGARQIAVLLHERCREEIESRARGALSIPPPPPMSASPPHSGPSSEAERRSHPSPVTGPVRRNEMSMFAGVLAVLVGVVLGLSVLFYVAKARRNRAEAVGPKVAVSARAAVSVAPSAVLNVGELDHTPTPSQTDALAQVRLDVPDGARLFIDGRELPAGTRTVPRPDAGVVHVVVKAVGSQDAPVVVSPDSPAAIEVVLQKKKRAINPVATVSMPPNPYD
jgi:hypothetical protein